jgi:hypothetical protein
VSAAQLNVAPVPRVTLSVQEACEALGVSWAFWREHIEPEIRVIRIARRKMIAVSELQRWAEKHGEAVGERI